MCVLYVVHLPVKDEEGLKVSQNRMRCCRNFTNSLPEVSWWLIMQTLISDF